MRSCQPWTLTAPKRGARSMARRYRRTGAAAPRPGRRRPGTGRGRLGAGETQEAVEEELAGRRQDLGGHGVGRLVEEHREAADDLPEGELAVARADGPGDERARPVGAPEPVTLPE